MNNTSGKNAVCERKGVERVRKQPFTLYTENPGRQSVPAGGFRIVFLNRFRYYSSVLLSGLSGIST